MVLLAAGSLRHQHFVSIWGIDELRRIDVAPDSVYLGALTTFSDVQKHETLRDRVPAAVPGGRRDRRDSESEPRHHRRQHCECVAGGGYAARAARLRRRRGDRLDSRPAPGAVPAVSHRLQADGSAAGRVDRACPAAAANGDGSSTTGKWVRAGRRPSRRSVLPPRHGWTQGASRTSGSRSGAWRQRSCVRRRRSAPCRASISPPDRIEAAVAALASDLAPIDDLRSTARYRSRVAHNLLREFLTACAQR